VFLKIPWLVPGLTLALGAFLAWVLMVPRVVTSGASVPIGAGSDKAVPTNAAPTTNPPFQASTTAPLFYFIRGSFVVVGKQPDGDSVRFVADDIALFNKLEHHSRIRFSKDNSVQLRFEAIDAPELHYLGQAQPLGGESRDALLKMMGFGKLNFKPDGATVVSATVPTVRGAILATAVEVNGRPISYGLLETDVKPYADGIQVAVTNEILQKTLNAKQLANGMAYLTVYSSNPTGHQVFLRGIATKARSAKLGVWSADASANFKLETKESVAQNGVLIFPKLFRRCISYLNAKAKDPSLGSFTDWLRATQTRRIVEDDLVLTKGKTVRLSSLIGVNKTQLQFRADPLEIVFVEK
jgi:endonuclease YncB( thermonuclease family)